MTKVTRRGLAVGAVLALMAAGCASARHAARDADASAVATPAAGIAYLIGATVHTADGREMRLQLGTGTEVIQFAVTPDGVVYSRRGVRTGGEDTDPTYAPGRLVLQRWDGTVVDLGGSPGVPTFVVSTDHAGVAALVSAAGGYQVVTYEFGSGSRTASPVAHGGHVAEANGPFVLFFYAIPGEHGSSWLPELLDRDSGEVRPVAGGEDAEVAGLTTDGRLLYIEQRSDGSCLTRLDPSSWHTDDPCPISVIPPVPGLSPDGALLFAWVSDGTANLFRYTDVVAGVPAPIALDGAPAIDLNDVRTTPTVYWASSTTVVLVGPLAAASCVTAGQCVTLPMPPHGALIGQTANH